MIAVAGGLLLALLVVFLLIGFVLAVRDGFRFLGRNKRVVGIVALAFGIWATITVVGMYSTPYGAPPAQH